MIFNHLRRCSLHSC